MLTIQAEEMSSMKVIYIYMNRLARIEAEKGLGRDDVRCMEDQIRNPPFAFQCAYKADWTADNSVIPPDL